MKLLLFTLIFCIFPGISPIFDDPEIMEKFNKIADEILQSAHTKHIILNGNKMTIHDLYNDASTAGTLQQVSPSEEILWNSVNAENDQLIGQEVSAIEVFTARGEYIDRKFEYKFFPKIRLTELPADILKDTPTVIANSLAISRTGQRPLFIMGDARSGKTCALRKIQCLLVQLLPKHWTIFISSSSLTLDPLEVETLRSIVEREVGPQSAAVFDDLLARNPKKLIFLLDGVDLVLSTHGKYIIESVLNSGATVIMTGRPYALKPLKYNFIIDVINIQEMTYVESMKFLRAIWKNDLIREISNRPSLSSINDYLARLDTYTEVFTHTLFKTNLPRQPVALMVLAEAFQRQQSAFSQVVTHAYPVGCLDYILDPLKQSFDLPVALENVVIDKKVLFDAIVSKYIGFSNRLEFQYGIIALTNCFNAYEPNADTVDLLLAPIEERLTAAKATLTRLQPAALFVDIVEGDRIRFIHKEFESYFAAQVIFTLIDVVEPLHCTSMWTKIILNGDYSSIQSFIDGHVRINPDYQFPIGDRIKVSTKIQTIKNLINNGFQNLFINYFRYQVFPHQNTAQLRDFFFYSLEKFAAPKLIFGMVRSSDLHPDPDPFDASTFSVVTCTPVEFLAERNMLQGLQALRLSIWFSKSELEYQQHYSRLLHRVLAKPLLNNALAKFLMENTVRLGPDTLNELLFLCVNEAGNSCRWLAEYLVEQGAVPARTVVRGQSLLHAAVKWNNVHLLRFCIDDLHVPALDALDHTGLSVFARALDANPSPFFTVAGWWEMMNYLIHNVKHLILPTNLPLPMEQELLAIPNTDLNSPWMKMLTFSEHQTAENSISVIRGELNEETFAHVNNIARFTAFKSSWPLSSKTLALRRNLWISRVWQQHGTLTVSISEMLVYFRGVITLLPQQNKFYMSSLLCAIKLEREHLSSRSIQRLLEALSDNIFDHTDLIDLQTTFEYLTKNRMLSRHSVSVLRPFLRKILNRLYSSRMSIQSENHGSDALQLSDRLLQSNNDYRPVLFDRVTKVKLEKMVALLEKAYLTNPTTSTDNAVLQCLSFRRSRRDVGPRFCMVSWTDVDAVNDAHHGSDRRIISRVRVNSDKFLQLIDGLQRAQAAKADQLVDLVRAFIRQEPEVLVGASKILVRDVVEHGGLDGYRKFQRMTAVINDAWRQRSTRPQLRPRQFPSRTIALHAAASIPLLRGLHVTIATCLHQSDNPDRCWYASGVLALSAGIFALSVTAGKFVPWLVKHFSQAVLDFLPASTPTVIYQYLGHMRYLGLRYGVKTFGYALGIIGIGFDLFNIVQMSQMIDACSQPDSGCRDRDKAEYIITLTFSCVAITVAGGLMMSGVGFVPGLLIGLALLVLEQVTLGLSAVYYYSRDYRTTWSENARIFWHKIILLSVPQDIQVLENRTDWTNLLHHQIEQQLEKSDARIVAYAVGLGAIGGGSITAGYAFIDMENDDVKNAEGLSRVHANAQNWTTLLCSPRYDPNALYADWSTQSASSVYRCENAFVVGHKNRWKKRSHESYIFYNLEYVSRGTVIGCNSLNNIFSIYSGSVNIFGGNGNITNTYVIQGEPFTGMIKLPGGMSRNILDFSSYAGILNFHWFPKFGFGHVGNTADERDLLRLYAMNESVNLAVIGRTGEVDTFSCNYSEQLHGTNNGTTSVVVNGGGGRTFYSMDTIVDCEKSVIHPFTHVIGSNSSPMYTVYVPLSPMIAEEFIGKAEINPDQSNFIVTFINNPIFISTMFVRYKPKTNTLVWKVFYTSSQSLHLSIKPYRSVNPTRQRDKDPIESVSVNCVFVDGYHGTTVYPVIEIPSNTTPTSVAVRMFNIFGKIDSILLSDVLKVYHSTQIHSDFKGFSTVTKLTQQTTGQSFTFGSTASDRFYVDGNSTFFYGGNGQDFYALNRNSSRLVWIENEALDDALDTLIIPSGMCDESLRAFRGSEDSECCHGSEDDVTLVCTLANSTSEQEIRVVLRSYLMDQRHRHLQIYWRDGTYVLLLPEWISQHSQGGGHLPLGLFFNLAGWQSTILTLTSSDTYLVLGISNFSNPLIAYSSGERDLVLATKFFSRDASSFALLQDFFADNTSDAVINPEWEGAMVFTVQNSPNNLTSALGASDILNLYFETVLDDNSTDSEFIKEYLVNMGSRADENQTILIDHNNSSSRFGNQIGVLALIGVPSGPLQATWTDNGTSLSLENFNTHIVVKNWCHKLHHRLQRIEWYRNFYDRPSVIRYLDHLECPRKKSTSKITIDRVNATLHAIYKLVMDSERIDNDNTQLVRCVGSIFAENVVGKFFFRLFDFACLKDQIYFLYNTCYVLLTESKLQALSYEYMRRRLQKIIEDFSVASGGGERESLNLLQKQFDGLGDDCWKSFKNGLKNITSGDKHTSLDLFNILPKCAQLST